MQVSEGLVARHARPSSRAELAVQRHSGQHRNRGPMGIAQLVNCVRSCPDAALLVVLSDAIVFVWRRGGPFKMWPIAPLADDAGKPDEHEHEHELDDR